MTDNELMVGQQKEIQMLEHRLRAKQVEWDVLRESLAEVRAAALARVEELRLEISRLSNKEV